MIAGAAVALLPYMPLFAVLFVFAGLSLIGLSAATSKPGFWDRFGTGCVLLGLVAFGAASAGVGT